jgi:hypothetical protein
MNWKDLEAVRRGLRNVRSRNVHSGTEENYDENPASIAGVSALTLTLLTWRIWLAPNNVSKWQMGFNMAFKGLIRIGYLPYTDVEHYLLGDQFRNINFHGTERIPVPMRYPKSEITPSKKCARAYSKSKYNFRRLLFC